MRHPGILISSAVALATGATYSKVTERGTAFVVTARMQSILSPSILTPAIRSQGTHAGSTAAFPETDLYASVEEDVKVEDQMIRREHLKRRLLDSMDEYNSIHKETGRTEANNSDDTTGIAEVSVEKRIYVVGLLRRVVRKILRLRGGGKEAPPPKKAPRKILGTDSFGTLSLEVGKLGGTIISLAEQLAELNPNPIPTYGWQRYGGGDPKLDSKLDGTWKLRFTTAADATFPESPSRGRATTSQVVDATEGTFTNVVDFEKGKLKGFRVVVAGRAASDTEIDLTFRRVILLRKSRFLRRLVIPIPAGLLRTLQFLSRGRAELEPRGPYFEVKYLDDDMRMHKTGEGNWFIQSRLAL